MNNPFQEQLLKAGLASKKQVQKAKQARSKKNKQRNQKQTGANEAQIQARQAAVEKANRDRELNQKKEQETRNKSIAAEINQLIKNNALDRKKGCEVVYNFTHAGTVKRLYINEDMRQQLIQGKLGIAQIEQRYELVPLLVAEKIQQRDEMRVVLFNEDSVVADDKDDLYADYQIPDDLMW
ncbi:MAG: DUF2058 domain-containing protein [Gammaproteobacteria bacterium]|nr:DUF2058 domain-containing protein [Gammaproteobacteria bacterium]